MQSEPLQQDPVIQLANVWHLCWRAAIGRQFFPRRNMRDLVRDRLLDAHRGSGRRLIDFCLTPREIHAISQLPPDGNPGDVARAFGNVVARWVRDAQPIKSHVFAGPFSCHRVPSEAELRHEVRMLAWRPVVLQLCSRPIYQAGGTLRIALGQTPARGFDSRPLLQRFGPTLADARAGLRALLGPPPSERDWRVWELAHGLTLAPGNVGPQVTMAAEVRTQEAAALIAFGSPSSVDGALDLLSGWVTSRLDASGRLDLNRGSEALAGRGRALVGRIAVAHALCSASSVARYFGKAKATLSEQIKASRERVEDQAIVATPVQQILEDVAKRSSTKR